MVAQKSKTPNKKSPNQKETQFGKDDHLPKRKGATPIVTMLKKVYKSLILITLFFIYDSEPLQFFAIQFVMDSNVLILIVTPTLIVVGLYK